MYSPTDIDFCYRHGRKVIKCYLLISTYPTHEAVSLELDAYEEGRPVKEEHVPLLNVSLTNMYDDTLELEWCQPLFGKFNLHTLAGSIKKCIENLNSCKSFVLELYRLWSALKLNAI